MKKLFVLFFMPLFSLFSFTQKEIEKIGDKIWKNECNQSIDQLTFWNPLEPFPSFGIGHFIWYPEGKNFLFVETFPKLLDFLKKEKISLPSWLNQNQKCPWQTREFFYQNFQSEKMKVLRIFLLNTRHLQAKFIVQRLEEKIPEILTSLKNQEREKVQKLFQSLYQTPEGTFALIDYLNFKGLGISSKETYQNQGWGLKQVLLHMPLSQENELLKNFVTSAKEILFERTENAPAKKDEKKFLKGWYQRLDSYLDPF